MEKVDFPVYLLDCKVCDRKVQEPYMCQNCQKSCHKDCLTKAIKETSKCPLCFTVMTLDEILKNRVLNEVKITNEPYIEEIITNQKNSQLINQNTNNRNQTNYHSTGITEQLSNLSNTTYCQKHTGSPLEYYLECDNLFCCKYCISDHKNCLNNKKILIKELNKPDEELSTLTQDIKKEHNRYKDTQQKHESKYEGLLIPFCMEVDLQSNKMKETFKAKAAQVLEEINTVYNELLFIVQRKTKETMNVDVNNLIDKLKKNENEKKEIDEKRLFNLEAKIDECFSLKAFQPPIEKIEYLIKMPDKKKINSTKFSLYNKNWVVIIKIINGRYSMIISQQKDSNKESPEIKFLWSIWLYNHKFIQIKKKFEYLTSFDQNFYIQLTPYKKEYEGKLFIIEIGIRPDTYLNCANAYDIKLEQATINPPLKKCLGGLLQVKPQ